MSQISDTLPTPSEGFTPTVASRLIELRHEIGSKDFYEGIRFVLELQIDNNDRDELLEQLKPVFDGLGDPFLSGGQKQMLKCIGDGDVRRGIEILLKAHYLELHQPSIRPGEKEYEYLESIGNGDAEEGLKLVLAANTTIHRMVQSFLANLSVSG